MFFCQNVCNNTFPGHESITHRTVSRGLLIFSWDVAFDDWGFIKFISYPVSTFRAFLFKAGFFIR
jgi:hypothetical protein